MTWTLLVLLFSAQALAIIVLQHRRDELDRNRRGVAAVDEAMRRGSHQARLQYPHVDLSRCMGSGTCIEACPEEGVLQLIHGQAVVVHGARCISCGNCARECPVGAITLSLGDVSDRTDLPCLTEERESARTPGLFLGGEVTGQALIRTAIEHGTAIANVVADRLAAAVNGSGARRGATGSSNGKAAASGKRREAATKLARAAGSRAQRRAPSDDVLDLCVVGAGPAGLACSLQAKARGLSFVTVEQEQLGGTVAKYPRRKLVMTQPVDLPLYGRLRKSTYAKEELMEMWEGIAKKHELPIRTGEAITGVRRQRDGVLVVSTKKGKLKARNVCLALGRRGTPRKLDVPGEDLPKVAYSLVDAEAYQGRRLLVVGGGDSAIEAAMALSGQPGNEVTLSYRKDAFFRIKSRNEEGVRRAVETGRLAVLYNSQVKKITPEQVELEVKEGSKKVARRLANDEVFVMAGGIPPFELLENSGVSFDPAERPAESLPAEQGTGLRRALRVTTLLTAITLLWVFVFGDYYRLDTELRFDSPRHDLLRPSGTLGLVCGIGASAAIVVNLLYLLRRSRLGRRVPGSLRAWMTSHIFTGIAALLLVVVHAAMAPRDTVGGHAFITMVIIVATGAIGRYLYSFVPRAANGKEQSLVKMRQRLEKLSGQWDTEFGQHFRAKVDELVAKVQWDGNLFRRIGALLLGQRRLSRALSGLQNDAREHGVPEDQIHRLVALARSGHRTALMAAHYEDLRAMLGTWRYLHRWVALLMVLLVIWHICAALRYGALLS